MHGVFVKKRNRYRLVSRVRVTTASAEKDQTDVNSEKDCNILRRLSASENTLRNEQKLVIIL